MARIRKHTEVTIESETLVIFRQGAGARRSWCVGCEAESVMLTPDTAASLAGVTTDVIYARVECDALHFKQLPDGTLLVCGPSLGLNQP